ncbi:hypothetical protein NIES593_09010 [Hydrococcus rivularis NIES-593]|uniref:EpsG family protein n=1 Tax=Hydrococcus rivularis NIES-593 TaxID=1921803 RepID=A0A1U7HJP0_9CYAN|nr:EpsG family protein [Hydrococcus rivularis]OKH23787.1 hypothetical protein NIES593_09010 [Hydrococcus rivularis NIES-593]
MFQAETPFVLFECLYLIVVLCYVFTQSKLVCWLAYSLAGLKYSLSSLESIDIITYEKIYKAVQQFGFEPFMGMEGAYTSLLYLAKIANLSLTLIHGITVIVFLVAVTFLFQVFLPKNKAIVISFFFGFVLVGGELNLYLLRQLLSTAIIFWGMSFLFKNKPFRALVIYLCGFLFHSSTAIYFPLFISGFFRKKITKILIVIGSYLLVFVLASNFELGYELISGLTGQESLYYTKYQAYTSFSGKAGWRDEGSMGLLTIGMILYFIAVNVWNRLYFFRSKIWLFYLFSFTMVIFQFALEAFRLFWISSRLNFISDSLLLISNILISLELIPKKYHQLMIVFSVVAIFWVSVYAIVIGYDRYGLYRFSL